jgi:hypothetical protein
VSRKEARKPKIWRKQALDLLDLALAREKAASDAWVEEIAANYDLTAGIVRQGLPALHNSFFRLADTLYDRLNERQRAQAEAELKLGYAEMLEAVSPTAKARKRRAKRKAATTQKGYAAVGGGKGRISWEQSDIPSRGSRATPKAGCANS